MNYGLYIRNFLKRLPTAATHEVDFGKIFLVFVPLREEFYLENRSNCMKILFGILCVATLTFSGCDTDVAETNYDTLPAGSIRFVNFLAGNPKMDVVVDDKTLGATATTNMDFGTVSGYAAVTGGTRNLAFDTTATDTKRKRVSANFIVTRAKATIYGAIDANKNPYLLGVIDTVPAALTSTTAAIRFIHAAGTRDSVTIGLGFNSSPLDSTGMTRRAPKSVTSYRLYSAPGVCQIAVYIKGNTPTIVQLLNIEAGKTYNFVLNGSTDPALPSINLAVVPGN